MTKLTLPTLFLLSTALALLSMNAQAASGKAERIKKCQDASGRWHYGDTADELCRQSKVVEINKQGITTKEIAAPLTAEELRLREKNKTSIEAEKKIVAEQARQDKLLLSTYGHEDDISFVRDRKIADTDAQIQSSQKTLTALRNSQKRIEAQAADEQRGGKPVSDATAKQITNTEAQIAKHEQYIVLKQKEIDAIRVQATNDMERYRHLKRSQSTPAPAAAAPAAR
jgi:hypothetical protein